MMKPITAIVATLLLAGCVSTGKSPAPLTAPEGWIAPADDTANIVETDDLQGWWKDFNDPLLDTLVQHALVDNPDRLMAQARIAEARGLRREARGGLFPQIDLSGSVGREDQGLSTPTYPDNFYDAAFDASYEIDLFGRNRNAAKAANERFLAAEQQYHNTGLSLVAEVVRTYIAYRQAQNRLGIANKNLVSQEETLKLIDDLYRLGVAPKLDVERANNLVNTTRASIPEFQRQADTARFQIAVLLGVFPDALPEDLQSRGDIPGANARPVLMAPAQILANRPDVKAAMHVLAANTALSNAAAAEVFPTLTLSGFYGIRDNGLVSAVNPWNVALGMAVSLIDFGRIEGRIDAAKAREAQAYQQYRKTVLQAVADVETALGDYAHIDAKRQSLAQAFDNARRSLELSKILFKAGEIAFLDVLDAQRTANNAESALLGAQAAQSEALTRLYKSLGSY